jgi:hypothetical protein
MSSPAKRIWSRGMPSFGTMSNVPGTRLPQRAKKGQWTFSFSQSASLPYPWDCHGCLLTLRYIGSTTVKFKITKGFLIDPPNLVTEAFFNAVCTMPSPHVKIVIVTSSGVTRSAHAALPWVYKPLYNWLLDAAHKDKLGSERIVAYCTGREWNPDDGEPGEDIMGSDWMKREGLPESGTVKDIVAVRPAVFVDGECRAEKVPKGKKEPYRVTDGDLKGAYTISRKDVAHFIVEGILPRWGEYKGKCLTIAY